MIRFALLLLGLASCGAPGAADPVDPAARFMPDAEAIGMPVPPWQNFCAREGEARAQCGAPVAAVLLTPERMAELQAVQQVVAEAIPQGPDPFQVDDDWRLVDVGQRGDCDDLALTKRDMLIGRGWPAGALRPAICYTWDQPIGGPEAHAVLTVETDQGTFVLGNIRPAVRLWNRSDCRDWVMRAGPGQWNWIAGGVRTLPNMSEPLASAP